MCIRDSLFPGAAIDPGSVVLALVVPLLALPQATHYLLDAWIWKVRPGNENAAATIGIAPPVVGADRAQR